MKVLLALDGLEEDAACVNYISSHTWAPGTEFGLLTVVEPHSLDSEFNVTARRQKLLETSEKLNKRFPGAVIGADCIDGHPRDRVLDMAFEWPADLIVVGARQKKLWQRVLQGSISQGVLEHAPCPVLIVRPPRAAAGGSDGNKVVVAVDGSAMSNVAMQWLALHTWSRDTHFCFVSVVPPLPDEFASESIEQAVADLGKRVDFEDKIAGLVDEAIAKFAPGVTGFSYSVETPTGDPTEEILRFAEREKANLIVVGSHGRTGMERMLLGSVSQSVAVRAASSVLVVKSGEFAGVGAEDSVYELENTEIMHHAETEDAHRVPYLH